MSDTADHDDPFAAEPIERDLDTDDMFGASLPAAKPIEKSEAYTVLARKYRPRTFEDLIGQEAMVRTLTNAFSAGRIAHAFMLTGVRGVGKTTTARLLARALNYESDTVQSSGGRGGPSVDLTTMGIHCQAIIDGRHIDVLELDAASRTGVDAMRDLLESVRYAPVEARYKVYVIDEVHMLSTGAFNALLKTLEEPPPHAKFIFATTEIRKVPVTILSRCQRFDLRRVEPETLTPHLEKICGLEGVRIDADAVALIARAAEGSVRDSLSLLDQALVQGEAGEIVGAEVVRDMLGLADRSATLALFENIISGQMSEALLGFRTLYGYGADPTQIMGDLLEYCHGTSVAKILGADATRMPKAQAMRVTALGAQLSAGTLSRLWTLMLKAFEELRRAPDAPAAFEMALVRLCYAADLPGPEVLMKRLQNGEPLVPGPGGGGPGGGQSVSGGAAQAVRPQVQQVAPKPQTFDQVLTLIAERRDIGLRTDVEQYVRLISFKPGAITFELAPRAPADLVRRLSMRLREWTGERWLIATEGGGGAESVYERDKRENDAARARLKADPFVAKLLETFPGAEITAVRARPQPAVTDITPAVPEDERIDKDED
ncbi:DNA polymerase III, subunits gamma and tau [Asticcacaulis biprosthecium C19]|uniref:DNA polymerase III subunit gamma/tau n=1 Tax=Asticcacaulis biprosthecium C19 TaxID=715226 RepID=F4QNP4_9CAUL|nr:DNA polymerase III subunit gamma/tau [Asticcacaulis biprosthecium]EGF90952.1 DNA polymerase III, subunits gamma and tau [Asticcacaulis biprosthecium C19]